MKKVSRIAVYLLDQSTREVSKVVGVVKGEEEAESLIRIQHPSGGEDLIRKERLHHLLTIRETEEGREEEERVASTFSPHGGSIQALSIYSTPGPIYSTLGGTLRVIIDLYEDNRFILLPIEKFTLGTRKKYRGSTLFLYVRTLKEYLSWNHIFPLYPYMPDLDMGVSHGPEEEALKSIRLRDIQLCYEEVSTNE